MDEVDQGGIPPSLGMTAMAVDETTTLDGPPSPIEMVNVMTEGVSVGPEGGGGGVGYWVRVTSSVVDGTAGRVVGGGGTSIVSTDDATSLVGTPG